MNEVKRTRSDKRYDLPTRGDTKRARASRKRRAQVYYRDVIEAAADLGIELGPEIASVPDVVMTVFRRTHALWLHAATEVDRLDADAHPGTRNSLWTIRFDEMGNRVIEQSKWIQAEAALREELFDQAMRMSHLKLDERLVAVEEATLAIIGAALLSAVKAAGLDEATQRAVGRHFRAELATIEGNATEVPEQKTPQDIVKDAARKSPSAPRAPSKSNPRMAVTATA